MRNRCTLTRNGQLQLLCQQNWVGVSLEIGGSGILRISVPKAMGNERWADAGTGQRTRGYCPKRRRLRREAERLAAKQKEAEKKGKAEALRREREEKEKAIRQRADELRAQIKKGDNPYLRLELGQAMAQLSSGAAKQAARSHFEAALALSFPGSKEIGITRYELGRLILVCLESEDQVSHQFREGTAALKRHLRYEPDDVEALSMMVEMSEHLGRDTAKFKDQLRIAKQRRRISSKSGRPSTSKKDISGLSFEKRCLEVVRSLGLIAVTTTSTGDGGIDIRAKSDNPLLRGKVVVQCKDWENPVGEPVLRDLLGVMISEDALKGVLMTSGSFTPAAERFAQGKRLELIGGEELAQLETSCANQTHYLT